MHPLVEHFLANKAEYHRSYFAAFVMQVGQQRARSMEFKFEGSDLAKEINKLMTLGEKPFAGIISAVAELTSDDLQLLVDNMPSGWERAIAMERAHGPE
jgi:hypothetical protein